MDIIKRCECRAYQYAMEHNMCNPEFMNNALIYCGLGILGYLFGDWSGLILGIILAKVITKGYAMCPQGKRLASIGFS